MIAAGVSYPDSDNKYSDRASMASVISTISTSETELILSTYMVTPTSTGGPARQHTVYPRHVVKKTKSTDVPMACPPPPAPNRVISS